MSHLDVVPVGIGHRDDPGPHPPFSGRIADGFIWGRGALDVKCGAHRAARSGRAAPGPRAFRPSGDVYFALGHDEELGGREGNRRVAEILRKRGVRFRFVLDEGGGLDRGDHRRNQQPVAFVGIAEKGYATIRLTAFGRGRAFVDAAAPHGRGDGRGRGRPAGVEPVPRADRRGDGRDARLPRAGDALAPSRRAANRWLTGGLIARQFAAKPSLNALIRTTMAATVVRGGETANVLPKNAEAPSTCASCRGTPPSRCCGGSRPR